MRVVGAADSKCQEAPPNKEAPPKYICATKIRVFFQADSGALNFLRILLVTFLPVFVFVAQFCVSTSN